MSSVGNTLILGNLAVAKFRDALSMTPVDNILILENIPAAKFRDALGTALATS